MLPTAKVETDCAACGQVFEDRTPLVARAQRLHEPFDDVAHIDRALIATPFGPGDLRPNQRPLSVGQFARVAKPTAVVPGVKFVCPHRKFPRTAQFRYRTKSDKPDPICY